MTLTADEYAYHVKRVRARVEAYASSEDRVVNHDMPPEKHGTYTGYCNFGCRCLECTVARATHAALRELPNSPLRDEARKISPIGTRRRFEALAWMGYPVKTLSKIMDLGDTTINRIMSGVTKKVYVRTRNLVDGHYRELIKIEPMSSNPYSQREIIEQRWRSLERGYVGPWVWDDIDDPDCKPWEQVSYPYNLEFVTRRRNHG